MRKRPDGKKYKDQQQQKKVSSKAYEFFSKGKTTVEVAITLNPGQPEITKLYKEYWELKRLHKLYSAYIDLGDKSVRDFLKLYKLAKKECSRKQVVNLLQLADKDNALGLAQI